MAALQQLLLWAPLCVILLPVAIPAGSAAGATAVKPDASCSAGAPGAPASKSCRDSDEPDPHVRHIIHATSVVAALADGGLSQIPGLGITVVPTVQAAMVGLIGRHYGCHMDASNALAVVTFLASGHAKKAMFKEVIGYIPLAGNVVKAGITGFMTEGIGNLANKMLRCPQGTDDLLKTANVGSESVEKATHAARHLFHLVSDHLGSVELGAFRAEEIWQRVRLVFSATSQEQLLVDVQEAHEASTLANIVRMHAWNLEVLAAALAALMQRFSDEMGSCAVVDFVGERLWAPANADAEARSAAAPYLLSCLPYASAETRRSVAVASARLLVDTRGGSRGGLAPLAVQQALELVAITVEEPAATAEFPQSVAFDFNASIPGDDYHASEFPSAAASPALPTSDIIATFSAAMNALQAGQGSACGALRALIRAEAAAGGAATVSRSSRTRGGAMASVRRLELLTRMEAPPGAELCLPSFRADLAGLLSLPALPANAEDSTGHPAQEMGAGVRRKVGGRPQLEDTLSAAVVGQRCAVERLAKHPGFARLKMRGLWAEKPLVLLLTGPSGTGKTLMARTLSESLLGRPIAELQATGQFRTFHMNVFSTVEDQKSFFGPPKGIVGVGDLPELLKTWPDAVILLDECEKAHPSFARALLKVFGEHGAVYDPKTGRDISSVNATFILTSNLAKDLISEHSLLAMQTSDSDLDCAFYGGLREEVLDALRTPVIRGRDNFFRESEVRGRLTDVLPFLPFGKTEVEAAVRRFLAEEAEVFRRAPEFLHASLHWEPEVVLFLASEYARRPEEGLRGVHTQLQARVREVFEYSIEAGLLQRSGQVVLRIVPGTPATLDCRVVLPRPEAATAAASSLPDVQASSPSGDSGHWAASWWPLNVRQASSQDQVLSGESRSSPDVGVHLDWEQLRDWDWQLLWQQLWEVLWEYWPYLLISSVALVAVASVSVGASVPLYAPTAAAAAAAPAAAPAVATAAASVGAVAAAPWLTSLLAGVQVAVAVGTTGATAWTASYMWQNRRLIAGIACLAGLTVLFLPTAIKAICQTCCCWLSSGGKHPRCEEQRRRPTRSSQDVTRQKRGQPKRLRTEALGIATPVTSPEQDAPFMSPSPSEVRNTQ